VAINVTSWGKKRFSAQRRQSFLPRALAVAIALRQVLAYIRFRNFALFTVRIFETRREINVARMQTRKTGIEGWKVGAARHSQFVCTRSMCSWLVALCLAIGTQFFVVKYNSSSMIKRNEHLFRWYYIIKIGNSAVKCCLLARLRTCVRISDASFSRDVDVSTTCVCKLRARIKLYLTFNYHALAKSLFHMGSRTSEVPRLSFAL